MSRSLGGMAGYEGYKDSGVHWIGSIPVTWEVKRLKYLAQVNRDVLPETTPPSDEIEYVDIGSVSYENGIERTEKFLFKDAPSRARRKAKIGDTVISTVRTYLKAIDFISELKDQYIYSTGFAIVSPRTLSPEFLTSFVKSNAFTNQVEDDSTGMSYPAINSTDLSNLWVAVPPVEEQTAIAAFLDQKTTQIDQAVATKEQQIALLKERKQILIQNAVTRGLNPDAPMRDSGVDWIGEVPEHWEIERFKYLFTQSRLEPRKGDGVVTSYRDGQVTLRSNRRLEGYTEAILEQGYQGIRQGQLVLNSMDHLRGRLVCPIPTESVPLSM